MKILVTGGAGFIGSNLVTRLLTDGHEVTVVDSLVTGRKENIEQFLNHPRFTFFACATESPEFVESFINSHQSFDRVYHLACPTGVPNITLLADEMLQACSFGAHNVYRLAAQAGAKLLFTSSSEIYGDPLVFPQTEKYTGNVDSLGPRANYEEGKRFSETLLKHFVDAKGLDGRLVRLFNVYGPNMSLADYRVVPRFGSQALRGEPVTVQGDGSQRRTMCYVSDLVAGLIIAMEQGQSGQAYNLGSDEEISMLDLARLIIKLADSRSNITFIPRPAHDHAARLPDLTAIKRLGWAPTIPLSQGLGRTLQYFQSELARPTEVAAQALETPQQSTVADPVVTSRIH